MAWSYIVPLVVGLGVLAWAARTWKPVTVYDGYQGVLYRSGKFDRVLAPGRYRFFALGDRTRVDLIQTSLQVTPAAQADVTSADGFLFRIAPSALVTVKDARAVALDAFRGRFHLLLGEAVVAAVGKVELKSFIEDRGVIAEQIVSALSPQLPEYEIHSVVITGVTLPPEIRRLMTEVKRAQLEGLAALERARGEQAALRALANAARMLKDNPDLARLRTLQAFEASKGATLVLGADKHSV